MKHCPTCKRAFDDDTLSFCLEDGTPLVADPGPRPDSQETLVSPRGPASGSEGGSALPPTQAYSQLPGKSTVSALPYQSPGAPYAKKRKTWPWVVGILAILSIVVVAIVAAFTVPGFLGSKNGNRPEPSPSRPVPSVTPTPNASPSTNDVPTDSAQVLAQLTKLEKDWTEANIKGDKQALEKILADDYVDNEDNSARTKREYIDSTKPDTSVENWEVYDVTVNQTGDRAVVSGRLKQETTDGSESYEFVDTFVWRDHRWQAVTAHTTSVK